MSLAFDLSMLSFIRGDPECNINGTVAAGVFIYFLMHFHDANQPIHHILNVLYCIKAW